MASSFSHKSILAFFALFALVSRSTADCPVENPKPAPGKVSGIAAYTYVASARNGPARWGDLDCVNGGFGKFSGCSYCKKSSCSGKKQSPINIETSECLVKPSCYAPVVNLHHNSPMVYKVAAKNFQIDCKDEDSCGSTQYKGKSYYFKQIHIHSQSEHSLDGKLYPLEIHFVHVSRKGKILVVSELFDIGEFNKELDVVFKIAARKGEGKVNLNKLVANARENLTVYKGSLTTPPCAEGVTFSVSRNVGSLSEEQLEEFLTLIGGKLNNRPVQPRNGRVITLYA